MRSGGYKCYNIKCGSCMGKTLCGEPADAALGCANRIVNAQTNADRIRAMSDEELAKWFADMWDCCYCSEYERTDCHPLFSAEPCDQKCEHHCLEWLKKPCEEEKE